MDTPGCSQTPKGGIRPQFPHQTPSARQAPFFGVLAWTYTYTGGSRKGDTSNHIVISYIRRAVKCTLPNKLGFTWDGMSIIFSTALAQYGVSVG